MGAGQLHLIIDKSLFQSLPTRAFTPLDRHFEVVIPPILFKEILGDLPKDTSVANLANRFGVNTVLLPPYQFMIIEALLGAVIPMDGRIIPAGLIPVRSADGKLGHKIIQTPEDASLKRWQKDNFTLEEVFWAVEWQGIKKFINASHYIKKISDAGFKVETPKNLEHLKQIVDNILKDPKLQGTLLGLMHSEFKPTHEQQIKILNRWNAASRPPIEEFAPYAAFCIRVNLMLSIGNQKPEILGTPHEHDLRDLEYCYYLPFCEVFASTDKIHKKLKMLLRPDQDFVGDALKTDLIRLADDWTSLTKEQKIERNSQLGFRPPEMQGSIVYELWEKHRPDPTSGVPIQFDFKNTIVKGPDGKQQTFQEMLMGIADKITNAEMTNDQVEDGAFLEKSTVQSKAKLEELFPHIDFDKVNE